MPEIVGAFAFRELGEEFADLGPQSRDRSFGGLTQQGLELGEGHFDGIEVRRIGREVQKFRAGRFDQCTGAQAQVQAGRADEAPAEYFKNAAVAPNLPPTSTASAPLN